MVSKEELKELKEKAFSKEEIFERLDKQLRNAARCGCSVADIPLVDFLHEEYGIVKMYLQPDSKIVERAKEIMNEYAHNLGMEKQPEYRGHFFFKFGDDSEIYYCYQN